MSRVFVKAVGSDLMRYYELHVVKITDIISINELNTDFTLQSYKTCENSSYHWEAIINTNICVIGKEQTIFQHHLGKTIQFNTCITKVFYEILYVIS